MTAEEVGAAFGLDSGAVSEYLLTCKQVVESEQFVAVLRGNQVHLAVRVRGLGGRKLIRECQQVLAQWYDEEPVLLAPVKHGNTAAIRIAQALGFRQYDETATHVWLVQTKEQFYA